jgi:hypothetical protein
MGVSFLIFCAFAIRYSRAAGEIGYTRVIGICMSLPTRSVKAEANMGQIDTVRIG